MELPIIISVLIAIAAIIGFFWSRSKPDSNANLSIPTGLSEARAAINPTLAPALDLSLLPEQFIVLDLETTGLSPETDEIIEFGAIRVDRDKENHASFSALVRPVRRIPRNIAELTGITQEMVDNDGIPLAEALPQFVEFIGDLPLVTFNADFDLGFLRNAAALHGFTIKNRYACALKMVRRAWPGLPSYRLAALAKMGNLSDDDTHRALGDCKRTVIVFTSSVSRIGEEIQWSTPQLHWREAVKYNAVRDANRAFVAETRPLEISDPAQAVTRYEEAMVRMYGYEKLFATDRGDDHILDRLTLCLWKSTCYRELVDRVNEYVGAFPQAKSSLMDSVLKRSTKAAAKLLPSDH
jgi:DNA polymerase III epsilon subunit family exonuclease